MTQSYDAFISYSRAVSTSLAVALRKDLERFAKPWNRLRARRIFRDDSSLTASSALWGSITEVMEGSSWLILLATPEAAASEYVERELDWWLRHKGPESILVVHAGGTIAWDRATGRFSEDATAIPPVLRAAFPEEPRWIDLSWFNDPDARQDPRFTERVADLAAAVSRVDRDIIHGENVKQHRKTLRLARAGIGALALLLIAALVGFSMAVVQRAQAQEESRISTARLFSSVSGSVLDTDLQLSRLLAVQGYDMHQDRQTMAALLSAVSTNPQVIDALVTGDQVEHLSVSQNGNAVVWASASGIVETWHPETEDRIQLGQVDGEVTDLAVSADGAVVALALQDHAHLWVEGEALELPVDALGEVAVSPSGKTIAFTTARVTPGRALYGDNHVGIVTIVDGKPHESSHRATFSPFANQLALPNDDQLIAWVDIDEYGTVEQRTLPDLTLVSTATGSQGTPRDFGGTLSPRGDYLLQVDRATEVDESELPLFRTDRDSDPSQPDLAGYAPGMNIQALAISPQSSQLAVAAGGSIYVSELSSPGSGAEPVVLSGSQGINHNGLAFDDQGVLVSAAGDTITRWQPENRNPLVSSWEVEIATPGGAAGPPGLAVNEDGSHVMVTETAHGFDLGWGITWHERTSGEQSSRQATFLDWADLTSAFVLEDEDIVRYGPLFTKEISRWNLPTDMTQGLSHTAVRATFLEDTEELLVAGHEGIVRVSSTGDPKYSHPEQRFLELSREGNFAVVTSPIEENDDTESLLDLNTGEVAPLLPDGTGESAVLGDASIWTNRATGEIRFDDAGGAVHTDRFAPTRFLRDGQTRFTSASVSPAGDLLASIRGDGVISVVDAYDGTPVGQFDVETNPFSRMSVSFSGDGRSLIAAVPAYDESFIAHVDMAPDAWRDVACASVAQALTREQWTQLSNMHPPDHLACSE